jgi:hypothetical protein
MKRAAGLFVILLLIAARGLAAESPGKAGDGNAPPGMEAQESWADAPLRMEELEVRGRREKPEVLYLPVHRGAALPSPVRYDLFLEDMSRPVFPGPEGALKTR